MTRTQLSSDKEIIIKLQGEAYDKAVNLVKDLDSHVRAETDDFIITIACQPAEGMYQFQPDGEMVWVLPGRDDNQHIKVMIQDSHDHRFVPELQVYCQISDVLDNFVEEKLQRFVWHPYVFQYGENWALPKEGEYIIKLTIKAPKFRRHDQNLGKRYNSDITLEFAPIHLVPAKSDETT